MNQPVSAVILTLNEEAVIERAVRSAAWADECLVVDSGSDDRTAELAEAAGARVVQQPWLGWTGQHERAAEMATHDWVFFLDADEVITPTLAAAAHAALGADPDPCDGFSVDRRGDFLGVLLANESRRAKRRSFVRLYHRGHSRWDPSITVHEEVLVAGRTHSLPGVLLHWRGHQLADYVPVFDRYAAVEARALVDGGARVRGVHVGLRPVLRFGWLFFVRGDWRLGTRGLIHAFLKAFQEFLRYARAWEFQNEPDRTINPTPAAWCAVGEQVSGQESAARGPSSTNAR